MGGQRVVQGCLAHKNQQPPQGPPYGPRHRPPVGSQEGVVSYERGTPVSTLHLDREHHAYFAPTSLKAYVPKTSPTVQIASLPLPTHFSSLYFITSSVICVYFFSRPTTAGLNGSATVLQGSLTVLESQISYLYFISFSVICVVSSPTPDLQPLTSTPTHNPQRQSPQKPEGQH